MPAALERTFVKDGKTVVTTDPSTATWLLGQGWTEQGGGTVYTPPTTSQQLEARVADLESPWSNWLPWSSMSPHSSVAAYGGAWGNGIQARYRLDRTQLQFTGMCRVQTADIPFNQWVLSLPGDWPKPPCNKMIHGGCTTAAGEVYCRIDVASSGAINVLPHGNGSPVIAGGWFGVGGLATVDLTIG